MKPVRKSFNRALYQAYDKKAKDTLVELLETKGHTIVNTEENYFVDVVSQKDGYTYFNEAEVKVAWKEDWPSHWEEIRIPERKQRLLDKYEGTNGVLNFYVFREDMKQAWRIKDNLLTKESLAEAKGRYIQKGELFFHIPYTSAELVNT
jgi:hypothetical protein|tara:strand:- start:112 stop:558 length:447 start_codon:yes stop_codon:yes gene_type:complete